MRYTIAALLLMAAGFAQGHPLSSGTINTLTPEGRKAIATDAVVASDGMLHVIWVEKVSVPKIDESGHAHNSADELHHVAVDPRTGAMSRSTRVNAESGEVWAFSRAKPVLQIDSKDRLHVLYTANAIDEDGRSAVVARYTNSSDGGRSWSTAKTLNQAARNDLTGVIHGGFAAAHTFGTLIVDHQDRVHAYWIDTRDMSTDQNNGSVFSASSTDGGRTFGKDTPIFRNDVCPCCQLTATPMGSGVMLASRRVSEGNFRDPAVAVSATGVDFSDRIKLGGGRWQLDGCPLKPVGLASRGQDVVAAYFTLGEAVPGAYVVNSSDGGASFSPARLLHPSVKNSDMPTVVAVGKTEWIAVWQAELPEGRALFAANSHDGGHTFSSPRQVGGGSGTPSFPVLVSGGTERAAYLLWLQGGRVRAQEMTPTPQLATP